MADLLKVVNLESLASGVVETYTIKAAAGSAGKILWLSVPADKKTVTATYVVDSGTNNAMATAANGYTFGTPPWQDEVKSAKKEMIIDDTAYVTVVMGDTAVSGGTFSYAVLNCTVTKT